MYAEQKGMVLVMALLFLLVVTLLVASTFSSSALQIKSASHFYQEKQAFEYAEAALATAEEKIDPAKASGGGKVGNHTTYTFNRLSNAQCGLFYQVDAVGILQNKLHLQSIFVFPYDGGNPCQDAGLAPHRVMWQQVNAS